MERGIRLIGLLVLAGVAPLSTAQATANTNSGHLALGSQTYSEVIQSVLDLTNQERARYDLPPLRMNVRLAAAADWMARDMAANSYVGHTDSTGRGIAKRVPSFGYTNYTVLRENLAGGHESPEEVVAAWMNSPGHRANILCERCQEIGISFYYDPTSKHRRYWVQEFGRAGR